MQDTVFTAESGHAEPGAQDEAFRNEVPEEQRTPGPVRAVQT